MFSRLILAIAFSSGVLLASPGETDRSIDKEVKSKSGISNTETFEQFATRVGIDASEVTLMQQNTKKTSFIPGKVFCSCSSGNKYIGTDHAQHTHE